MTRLWLVRHGPTHAKVMVGWSDLPADLSDHAAIARLRDYLPDAPVVSSDLLRATTTADALQPDVRLPHDPAMREINFGAWEMRSFADVDAKDPQTLRAYWETPGDIAPPNGESWHQVQARVDVAVDNYLTQGLPDLIIVGHFGMILTQVQRALRMSTVEVFGHKIDNLSITDLNYANGQWAIGTINHKA